jgi:hypothetical protein
MKKIYMTMVAMLCGVAAMAQESCTISAEDAAAVPGGETAYVEVLVNESTPGQVVTAASFRIQLPAGVGVAKVWSEDDEEWVDDVTYPVAKSSHNTAFQPTTNANEYQIAVAGTVGFKTSTKILAKIGIQVPEGFKGGKYELKFSKISFSNAAGESVYPQEDFTAYLRVGGTGIKEMNAIDETAPVFNVAGQRVNKAQKGVYIQNGKKVAVK